MSPRDGYARYTSVTAWGLLVVAMAGCDALVDAPAGGSGNATAVVVGYETMLAAGLARDAEMGEVLLGELNCLSCHAASDPDVAQRITTKPAPDLRDIGGRASADWIAGFLADPVALKPGTTMPDVLASYAAEDRQSLAEVISHFLIDQSSQTPPAGYSPLRFRAMVDRGRALFHGVGCAACHRREGMPDTPATPDVPLPDLGAKNSVAGLRDFLMNPRRVRHGLRMPSLYLSEAEATDIAVYLLREQRPESPTRVRGFEFEYFVDDGDEDAEGFFTRPPPDFDSWEAVASGRMGELSLELPIRTRRGNHGFRYSALIRIDAPGDYTFELASDSRSGSEILVDGDVVATKPRESGRVISSTIPLGRGDHPVEITYYMRGDTESPFLDAAVGGRNIEPGTPIDTVAGYEEFTMEPHASQPLVVDGIKAASGGRAFVEVGCASCHALAAAPSDARIRVPASSLTTLDIGSSFGSLWSHRTDGAPRYRLSDRQRQVLRAALADLGALAGPRDPQRQISHTLATYNCYACHARAQGDEPLGGPDPAREPVFRVVGGKDLGEEGRLPPPLTGIGARVKPEAVLSILTEDRLHVRRDFMQTRMPGFGGELIAALPTVLEAADATAGESEEPPFAPQAANDGLKLLGSEGLRCITCHDVGTHKSPGISTINLTTVYERLRPGWVQRFLRDPGSLRPRTRMPVYWDGEEVIHEDIADGTASGQIDAIWSALSLGTSMPAPAGMDVGDSMVLVPGSEVILFRTFMNEVGPRAITAGFPELVHVAFDANVVRLAKAWRGGFYDAKGTWQGRAGKFLDPYGEDIIDMPPGPAFAYLDDANSDWPQPARNDRDVGGQFQGYELDEQRGPIFRYRLGQVNIEEQPVPIPSAGGANLTRRFTLSGDTVDEQLYLLMAEGEQITPQAEHSWAIDGRFTVSLRSRQSLMPVVRSSRGVRQVLVPITVSDGEAVALEVEIAW
ncbi:MAG TPA: c-type cytochrome [Acidobacteriota bacterium]|nr:c-type cytochrome [Acidobacteriota bacterium]